MRLAIDDADALPRERGLARASDAGEARADDDEIELHGRSLLRRYARGSKRLRSACEVIAPSRGDTTPRKRGLSASRDRFFHRMTY
jgi:hypothetical protein